MKIIFLDIDGVLNCENGFKDGLCKYKDYKDIHHQRFYPPSKFLLNKLIDETGAKIVISSTWRSDGLEYMKKVWESEDMSGEIIGLTPHYHSNQPVSIPRGLEIKGWLEENKFRQVFWSEELQQEYVDNSDIENFIIIDDDSDMLYNQRQHFVHVKPSPRNKIGFNLEHYDESVRILNKKIVDLYYEVN